MNKAIWVSAMGAIGLAAAGSAVAEEVGRVISSTPIVQQVAVPRQVCNTAPVVQQQQGGGAGAVIGAIAGGILGHQVGGGFGQIAATGIGAVAGAAVGDNLERRNSYAQGPAQCVTQTSYENRTVGYNVEYEYAGKTFKVQMPQDPGATVRLQVTPVASSAPMSVDGTQAQMAAAGPATVQPVYSAQTPSVVYPAYTYPAYGYPAYYGPAPVYYSRPYYPPVSLSLGYVYGGGHWGHRRWR